MLIDVSICAASARWTCQFEAKSDNSNDLEGDWLKMHLPWKHQTSMAWCRHGDAFVWLKHNTSLNITAKLETSAGWNAFVVVVSCSASGLTARQLHVYWSVASHRNSTGTKVRFKIGSIKGWMRIDATHSWFVNMTIQQFSKSPRQCRDTRRLFINISVFEVKADWNRLFCVCIKLKIQMFGNLSKEHIETSRGFLNAWTVQTRFHREKNVGVHL